MRQESQPFLGQRDLARGAMQQAYAEILLEFVQVRAGDGRRQSQFVARLADVVGNREAREKLKVFEVQCIINKILKLNLICS